MLSLATAVTVATGAEAKTKRQNVRAPVQVRSGAVPGSGYALRARSPNPAWDVYRTNGEYAGSDPDPLVRMMLRKDDFTHDD
jgi:hypothetical protein